MRSLKFNGENFYFRALTGSPDSKQISLKELTVSCVCVFPHLASLAILCSIAKHYLRNSISCGVL